MSISCTCVGVCHCWVASKNLLTFLSHIATIGRVLMLVAGSSCYYIIAADVIAAAITKRGPGNLLPKAIATAIT